MTRKIRIILSTFIGLYIIFAVIVIILFNLVKNNPIDKIAMTYIWNSKEISEQVGEIKHVGRNVMKKTIKSESKMVLPYSIETQSDSYLIFITMGKENNKWVVIDFEVEKGDG